MSIGDKANFVRRLFVRYHVLVDFEGDVPPTLAQRLNKQFAARETIGKFCRRVLKRDPDQVMFFQGRHLPAQTQIASITVDAQAKAVSAVLRRMSGEPPTASAQQNDRLLEKLERRVKTLGTDLVQARTERDALLKKLQKQQFSPRSVDVLIEKLNEYLNSKVPVHELVAKRVREVVKNLEQGEQLADALWPLVVMADDCLRFQRKTDDELRGLREKTAQSSA